MKISIARATTHMQGGVLVVEADGFILDTSTSSFNFDELANGKLRVGAVEGESVAVTPNSEHWLTLEEQK